MLKQHRFLIPILILALVILAVVSGYFLSLPQGDELPASVRITLAAPVEGTPMGTGETHQNVGEGVPANATFVVTTGFPVSEAQLRAILEVDPPMNFQLNGGKRSWTIRPHLPLTDNHIYTFRVKNTAGMVLQSFAFQTRGDLLINNVFPADEARELYVETGIEVRFNQTGVDLAGHFEILPPVSGRFETRDYDCRFIPDAPLAHNSIYRVTIRAGLKAPSGAVLKEDHTFSFETASAEEDKGSWGDLTANRGFSVSYLPGDAMRVDMYGGAAAVGGTYAMTLHKFPGINAFVKEMRAYDIFYEKRYGEKSDYKVSTQGLDEIMSINEKLLQVDEASHTAPLPENLSEGYYVFTLRGEDVEGRPQLVQQLIQVVNLSIYTQSSDGDSLVWINDPVTKDPVSGAHLELETVKSGDKHTGDTAEDGTARLLTKDAEEAYLTVTREGTQVYFDRISLSSQAKETPLNEDYYTAIYTDRNIYRPGDLIHVWGVVKPRHITAPMPTEVYASFGVYWPETELSRLRLTVATDGTFSGTLDPGSMRGGSSYRIAITDGDRPYVQSPVQIENYTKPAYTITLTTDKTLYDYKEAVQFSVSANYYDGTPVTDGKLLVNCEEAGLRDAPMTLDASGNGVITGTLNPTSLYRESDVPSWVPQSIYWSVSSADAQDQNLYESATFTAMPSKIAAKVERDAPGELRISTAVIDESKVGPTPDYRIMDFDRFEQMRGVPADIPVTVIVHKTVFTRVQTGNVYDYVNKKNLPVYETNREESIAATVNATAVGGKATVKDLPYTDWSGGATPLMDTTDEDAAKTVATTDDNQEIWYTYEVRFAGGIYGDANEWLHSLNPRPSTNRTQYSFLPDENQYQKSVGLGEELKLGLYADADAVQNTGNVLYTMIQRGILTTGLYGTQGQMISMEEDFLPNVYLAGAYFDGRHVFPMRNLNLTYEYTPKTLTVEAVPDKESYRPGESMNLTLTVRDQEGKPVKAAAVVGVVDEAIFALMEQKIDLADQLYHAIYSPYIATYTSNNPDHKNTRDAEKIMAANASEDGAASGTRTGGGSAFIRNLFIDTAAFETVETDDAGMAQVTLTLPDNVTSWRITAAAVTGDLKAGDTMSQTAATLPFYLQTIVTKTYLEGDDISFSVRGVGTALTDPKQTISYSAVVRDGGGKEIDHMEKTGTSNMATPFNLGKYDAGAYRVTITGKYGALTDGVELPFNVTKSGLLVPQVKTMALAALPTLESALYPVKITVVDEQMKPCLDVLSLLSMGDGDRTEQIAAAYAARALYEALLPEETRESVPPDSRLDDIQLEGGGVRLLPGGGPDAALTAKLLMSAPELLRTGEAAEYLRSVLQDATATPDDRVMAYVGLAAVKEPVLLDLTRMLSEQSATLTPTQKLYLGAAFAKLGDFTTAHKLYDSCSDRVKNEGTFQYLEGDGTDASRRQTTAAALLLTAVSAHEDASNLARFFLSQEGARRSKTDSVLCQLELLAFAKNFTPEAVKAAARFTYIDAMGKPQDISLEVNKPFTVSMTAETLARANFKSISGKLYAAVSCYTAAEVVETAGSAGKLTVEKTYTPVMEAGQAVGQAATVSVGGRVRVTVKVKFDASAPSGCYTLTDYIPAGLRYLPGNVFSNGTYTPIDDDGQTIYANLYRTQPQEVASGAPVEKVASAAPAVEAVAEGADREKVIPNTSGNTVAKVAVDSAAIEAASVDSVAEVVSDESETDPNVYTITYYLSATLPGTFITESAYVTPHVQDIAARSGRGLIVVE